MIDPLHAEFLTIIATDCTEDEHDRLTDATRRLDAELWFLRGRDAGIRYSVRRYHPDYIECFGMEDYGEALPILREPIRC